MTDTIQLHYIYPIAHFYLVIFVFAHKRPLESQSPNIVLHIQRFAQSVQAWVNALFIPGAFKSKLKSTPFILKLVQGVCTRASKTLGLCN